MGINKIEFNGKVVMDLTGDTVTPETLAEGATAHDKAGDPIVGTMKQSGGGESVTELFYVQFAIGTTGFELDGVTYADIMEAWRANKRIIGKAYVPEQAGLGFSGNFELAMTYLTANESFVLSFITGQMSVEVFIKSDSSVSVNIKELAEKGENSGSVSLGVRYGFDANTGTLYLYGDGEVTGLEGASFFDVAEKVKHIVFFENISSVLRTAFRQHYPNLETVSFCNSVTSIGLGAFTGCLNLRSVHLPKDLTVLDSTVFAKTGLEEITIPAAVAEIEATFRRCENLRRVIFEKDSQLLTFLGNVFEGCTALEKIDLPKQLQTLSHNDFYGDTALKQIYLPVSLQTIGEDCFAECTALEIVLYGGTPEQWAQIAIDSGNETITENNLYFLEYSGIDEAASEKFDESYADAVGAMCERFYNNESGSYFSKFYLPDNADDDTYYAISAECGSESIGVDICEGIKELRNGAFAYSFFKEIKLPESLEIIRPGAFVSCENLESISIPENVTSLGAQAFVDCTALKRIYIPKRCRIEIGAAVFEGCTALTDIYYGGSEDEFFGHREDDVTSDDKNQICGMDWFNYLEPRITIHYNATGLPSEDGAE